MTGSAARDTQSLPLGHSFNQRRLVGPDDVDIVGAPRAHSSRSCCSGSRARHLR